MCVVLMAPKKTGVEGAVAKALNFFRLNEVDCKIGEGITKIVAIIEKYSPVAAISSYDGDSDIFIDSALAACTESVHRVVIVDGRQFLCDIARERFEVDSLVVVTDNGALDLSSIPTFNVKAKFKISDVEEVNVYDLDLRAFAAAAVASRSSQVSLGPWAKYAARNVGRQTAKKRLQRALREVAAEPDNLLEFKVKKPRSTNRSASAK